MKAFSLQEHTHTATALDSRSTLRLIESTSNLFDASNGNSEQVLTTAVKPPLKWAGGKRWQVPYIFPYWEPKKYRRLVEPFCGGLAVTLGLLPEQAWLNDINPHLINFYNQLKIGLVSKIKPQNNERYYYEARNEFNELLSAGKSQTAKAASLFYYLNRTGYNGLCRFNNSGLFNVPFGRYKRINYRDNFLEYVGVFQRWRFTNLSFRDLALHEHDFVYADPPYDVEFHHYSKGGFYWQDQIATAEWLSKHPGPVILVNQATPRIKELYQDFGFRLRELDAPRRISCNGDRSPAPEVLAVRNLP
jgi:DNA adenine methylase